MPKRVTDRLRPEIIAFYHEKNFQVPVIGVTGGKGGVGKTTVAVNIACALTELGHKVALVDADVDGPDAAILLGMSLDDVAEVAVTMPVIDAGMCNSCGACVTSCRLNALFLPQNKAPMLLGECNGCEACLLVCETGAIQRGKRTVGRTYKTNRGKLTLYSGELIPSREESAIVVARLKDRVFREAEDFDMLVVDTSPGAHCNVIKALQGADRVIAVTEPTPLGAHDFELILRLLDIFALKGSALLNRADLPSPKGAIERIAREYNTGIVAELYTDELLIESYVSGTPIVTSHPESASAKVFIGLAQEIAREFLR